MAAGEADTVIVAFCDMQGRLTGKRVSARLFVEDAAAHGAECCNCLLAVDVEMNTVDGYSLSSWETGYGDMLMTPDFATLRLIPWLPGTALVLADLTRSTGAGAAHDPGPAGRAFAAPRPGALRRHRAGVHGVRQQLPRRVGGGLPRADARLGLQHGLRDAGLDPDGAAAARHRQRYGRCGHVLRGRQGVKAFYKNGAKKIADRHGKSVSFIAKYDEREGNSCHIHVSLRGADGAAVFADTEHPGEMSAMLGHFVAGQLATLRELALCYAPNINSYKRFVDGSCAPTAVAWGMARPPPRHRTACSTTPVRTVGRAAGFWCSATSTASPWSSSGRLSKGLRWVIRQPAAPRWGRWFPGSTDGPSRPPSPATPW